MSIAENIKALRDKFGLTQQQLGEIAGVSDKAVSTWESGNVIPRMGAIDRMASYFGISKSDIIEDEKNTISKLSNANGVPVRPITDAELKFALFDGDQTVTDAQFEEVKRFAQFIRERDRRDK